jgi:glycine oxidase
MLRNSSAPPHFIPVTVIGAGIAGAWQALTFARAGHPVTLFERDEPTMLGGTSRWAGGMLAPYCEQEAAEPAVTRLGRRSLELWHEEKLDDAAFNGSLVVAHARDRADFERFARMTENHAAVGASDIATLEPDLAGRFHDGLFFAEEGHVEPRRVLPQLYARLAQANGEIRFGTACEPHDVQGIVIDCRGLAAADSVNGSRGVSGLRGVKGEAVILETGEIKLTRPVRVMHPRWPLYIVPRAANRFFVGATSIESEDGGVAVRSVLELLTAAYAVHPAFAEARIVEIGAALRPAFPDNLPRIAVEGRRIGVNGLYRHGFLLAPALAELTLAYVARGAIDNEVMRCA